MKNIICYRATTSNDVWQFGIVIFVCLTGCLPWQKAATDDPRYTCYLSWQSTTIPIKRQPKLFKLLTSKAQRFFKKYLEPKPEKRPAGLAEIYRYIEDRWLSKGMEKTNEESKEDEGLCPSMYSFHSSPEEKSKLLDSLAQYGLETTVDRVAKKDRIRQWIQNSIIDEGDENEEELDEEGIRIRDNQNGPIGERINSRGPISNSNLKRKDAPENGRRSRRATVIRKDEGPYVPPIDPRIPFIEQKKRSHIKKTSLFHKNGDVKNTNRSDIVTTYNIQKSLPFQNMRISNSLGTSESTLSSDSINTVRHNIHIQIPQASAVNNNYLNKFTSKK